MLQSVKLLTKKLLDFRRRRNVDNKIHARPMMSSGVSETATKRALAKSGVMMARRVSWYWPIGRRLLTTTSDIRCHSMMWPLFACSKSR